jgi:molybdate transport system substrate-binding protein
MHLPTQQPLYAQAKLFTVLLVLTLLSISLTFSSKVLSASEKPLRIAVSSNFTPVLKKLLVEFHQQTNIDTQIISGATGALFLQIQHGAPFDIFIAADSIRPAQLEQQGLLVANSRQTYALGQLALLSMNSNAKVNDITDLSQRSPQRFAIANPDTAPYGKAAKETLEHIGLWQQYQPTLIMGININQTFAQVRSQAVTQGLVAYSQLVLNNLAGVIIPASYHQPIAQQLAIIKSSTNINKAKKLSEYLLSPKVQQKIVEFGYASFGHARVDNNELEQENDEP